MPLPLTGVLAARAVVLWVGILVLAIGNGLLREALLVPNLGAAPGYIASGLLLCALILLVTYLALPWLRACRPGELIGIGLGWVVLTLVFEAAFGRFQGKSWSVLLGAYTFEGGNIWPLVLLVTAGAPCIAARLRGRV